MPAEFHTGQIKFAGCKKDFLSGFGARRAYKYRAMPSLDDMELLKEYVEHGSDAAFEAILNRHVNLVYSTALRQVREESLAAEVTQITFIILARKARSLGKGTILSGWLYRTAQFAANRAVRTEARRRDREKAAAFMQLDSSDTHSVWEHLSPVLDQAMADLGENERNAIVLRYFENKTSRDVALALGINEATAQKRVARAMEKLRRLCTKRGVVLPVITMSALISAHAVKAAPIGVSATTAAAVTGSGASGSTMVLVKGTLKLISWAKYKVALYLVGVVAIVSTTAVLTKNYWAQPKYGNRRLTSWLAQMDDGQRDNILMLAWQPWQEQLHYSPAQNEAAQAVRSMGASAIPLLMSWLQTDDSELHQIMGKFGVPPETARHRAMLGLDALGPVCAPEIPELTRLLHGDLCPKEAAAVLAAIGPDGWQVLTKCVSDTNTAASTCSIWALGAHRASVPGTVEALENAFMTKNESADTALTGWALAEIGQDREQVVSLLIKGLGYRRADTRWGCAMAAGLLGHDAESAVPYLEQLLKDPDPAVSQGAAHAIHEIDPQEARRIGIPANLGPEHIAKTMFY